MKLNIFHFFFVSGEHSKGVEIQYCDIVFTLALTDIYFVLIHFFKHKINFSHLEKKKRSDEETFAIIRKFQSIFWGTYDRDIPNLISNYD